MDRIIGVLICHPWREGETLGVGKTTYLPRLRFSIQCILIQIDLENETGASQQVRARFAREKQVGGLRFAETSRGFAIAVAVCMHVPSYPMSIRHSLARRHGPGTTHCRPWLGGVALSSKRKCARSTEHAPRTTHTSTPLADGSVRRALLRLLQTLQTSNFAEGCLPRQAAKPLSRGPRYRGQRCTRDGHQQRQTTTVTDLTELKDI